MERGAQADRGTYGTTTSNNHPLHAYNGMASTPYQPQRLEHFGGGRPRYGGRGRGGHEKLWHDGRILGETNITRRDTHIHLGHKVRTATTVSQGTVDTKSMVNQPRRYFDITTWGSGGKRRKGARVRGTAIDVGSPLTPENLPQSRHP